MPSPGVKARIERFWRSIRRMRSIASTSLKNFLEDENLVDAGERNLHIAVEALIDVILTELAEKLTRAMGKILKYMSRKGIDP